jgi:hypothetical protein
MISIREVVVFVEDECLGQLFAVVALPYLRQDHEALLPLLDEPVEGVVTQRVKLHALPDPARLHHQRWVAYLAFHQDLHQLSQKRTRLIHCLLPFSAANPQHVHYPSRLHSQLFRLGDLRYDGEVARLEGLAQDVHEGTLEGL